MQNSSQDLRELFSIGDRLARVEEKISHVDKSITATQQKLDVWMAQNDTKMSNVISYQENQKGAISMFKWFAGIGGSAGIASFLKVFFMGGV